MSRALGARLVEAIAAQDVSAIAGCFAENAQSRALIPPGLRERTGPSESASLIAAWFADSTELDLLDSHTDEVEDRLHVSYRFAGVEEGQPYLVEQHIFCSVWGLRSLTAPSTRQRVNRARNPAQGAEERHAGARQRERQPASEGAPSTWRTCFRRLVAWRVALWRNWDTTTFSGLPRSDLHRPCRRNRLRRLEDLTERRILDRLSSGDAKQRRRL